MNETMSQLPKSLHPMTVRDILDRSIQLYKDNLFRFIGIILLVKGPYLILENFLMDLIESSAAESAYAPGTALLLVRFLEPLLIVPILTAVMTTAISEQFLNRYIGIIEAYSRILRLRTFFVLLGTIILSGVVIGVGFMVLLIPGLIFWVWFAFIPQTVVIEGEGGIGAMKRSKYLVKGYFTRTFALFFLIFIAVALVTGIISYVVTRLPFLGPYSRPMGEGTANVISVLLEPFRTLVVTLLYYDFRVRKEGFDLEIMAKELATGMENC